MDPERVAFLFGEVPDHYDLDDEDDRLELLADRLGVDRDLHDGGGLLAFAAVVAGQVLADDPPEVWATAQRLTSAGFAPDESLRQLAMAVVDPVRQILDRGEELDVAGYVATLERLPLPDPADVEAALVEEVRARRRIDADELERAMCTRFGSGPDDPLLQPLVDDLVDDLVASDVLAYVHGDDVVHVGSLLDGIVLTHTVNEVEVATDTLSVAADLAPFADPDGPRLVTADGTTFTPFSADRGHVGWRAPDEWLARLGAGTTIAVRVPGFADLDADTGSVALEVAILDGEPPVEPGLVAALRRAYDSSAAEVGLPARVGDLLLSLVAEDAGRFRTPQAPLAALCEAAGLERRGDRVADDPSQWDRQLEVRRMAMLHGWLQDDDDAYDEALDVLAAFGRLDRGDGPEATDPRPALRALHRDGRLLAALSLVLLGDEGDHDLALDAVGVADGLVAAASRPAETAVARWLAALAAERQAETLVAEQHLELAVAADREFEPAVERLAWYRSDRGDAAGALRLLARLADRDLDEEELLADNAAAAAGPKLGRNERCWCGSGRKFKQCHEGQPALAPLPERVGWLCRKAVAFVERQYLRPPLSVLALAGVRAGSQDPEALADAGEDPLLFDVALHEEGWFEEFLRLRGPLLPDDELLLARAWQLADRSVHEVVHMRRGEGLTLRDLRTGETVEVTERALTEFVQPGMLVCARVVPDGEGHQIVGGVFPVAPGTERQVLDVLDGGDGVDLLAYRARLDAPPELVTGDGEPAVQCSTTLVVDDPAGAAAALDGRFGDGEADGEARRWLSLADDDPGGDDGSTVLAMLRLEGATLVVEAISEQRADAALAELQRVLPGARVLDDRRQPFPVAMGPHGPEIGTPEAVLDEDVAGEILDRLERRWCDEEVPALGGLTPRQAAADPTRREELVRLVASFPDPSVLPPGQFSFRPDRLRHLLGIDPDE